MSNLHSTRRMALGAMAAGWMATWPAWAQSKYPAKPVRMIVPFPAGGGPDSVGRLVAQILGARWGQSIVVENIAGASGQIGTQAVVRAQPDGHTLLFAPPTPIPIAELFLPKPSYEIGRAHV